MEMKFYRCAKCGQMVAIVEKKGCPIMCCGQAMEEIIPGTTDAAAEKHVPVIRQEDNLVTVTVGEVEHPMIPEHFIEWIALETDDELILKKLTPADPPKAEFTVAENKKITAFSYCNLHSLWKN